MKSIVTIVLFLTVSVCNAQLNNSIMIIGNPIEDDNISKVHTVNYFPKNRWTDTNPYGSKTTAATVSSWFDMFFQNYVDSISAGFYYKIYPDSNVLDNSGSTPYYINCHGIGMSFDPTDIKYFSSANYPIYYSRINGSTPYVVDSFMTYGKYVRNNLDASVVDSLVVDLIVTNNATTDSGVYKVQLFPDSLYDLITSDSRPRFATARYNRIKNDVWDSVKTTRKVRLTVPLTTADTGVVPYYFAIPNSLMVPQGQKVVSYVHFKSGVNYPLGTTVASANTFCLYSGLPWGYGTWPQQEATDTFLSYEGSFQTGLIATNQIRYNESGYTVSGKNVLIPAFAYNTPPAFAVPWQSFHLKWEDATTNINSVNSEKIKISVFPNPANDRIQFAFEPDIYEAIYVYNVLGQQVSEYKLDAAAGFAINTTNYPTGSYVYVLQKGGKKQIGKFYVQH